VNELKRHILFGVVCLGLSACSQKVQQEQAEKEESAKQAPIQVPIATVQTQDLSHDLLLQGIVGPLPDHSVKVSPAMAGKLSQVFAVNGQTVKRGQLLAQLDDRHIREQLDQQAATVQAAQVNLQQAQAALNFAKENLERQKNLFQAEVAAKKDILAAQNQVETEELHIQSLQSQLHSAKAGSAQIQTELALTQVKSPIEGVVANRFLNVGDTVDPNTPILQIVGLQNVVINALLPADSPQQVKVGEHARIHTDAQGDTNFQATISSISPIIDRASNSIAVQLLANNQSGQLRDGQVVTVLITDKIDRSAVVIPQSALVPDPNKPEEHMVYVVRDGKATRVPVVTGNPKGNVVEIIKGLRAGQSIVSAGGYGLPDHSLVTTAAGRGSPE